MYESIPAPLKVTEVFDLSDIFQSRILNACSARNDLIHISMLFRDRDENLTNPFLLKFQIAVLREALFLINILFEPKDSICRLIDFDNWEKLKSLYEELRSCTDSLNPDSGILKDFLIPARNVTYHYKDDDKKGPQYKLLNNEAIDSIFEFSNDLSFKNCYGRNYVFADEVYYKFIIKKWKDYRKLTDADDAYKDFITRYEIIVSKTLPLLDAIFDGYCNTYLSINYIDGEYQIKKNNI